LSFHYCGMSCPGVYSTLRAIPLSTHLIPHGTTRILYISSSILLIMSPARSLFGQLIRKNSGRMMRLTKFSQSMKYSRDLPSLQSTLISSRRISKRETSSIARRLNCIEPSVMQSMKWNFRRNGRSASDASFSRACGVCFTEDSSQLAVLTSCGHLLCSACTIEMTSHLSDRIVCPFCRTFTGYVLLVEEKAKSEERTESEERHK
ncbi:hypothetical protein PENTCL1PPCAC_11028, partial [Pristionchus entomophagus]